MKPVPLNLLRTTASIARQYSTINMHRGAIKSISNPQTFLTKAKLPLSLNAQVQSNKISYYDRFTNLAGKYLPIDFGHTALHLAVKSGREDIVCKHLKLGGKKYINVADKNGLTPLHVAIINTKNTYMSGRIINQLLANGADVNAVDKEGKTPLYHAIMNANSSSIKTLLEHGADVNAVYNDNKTLLHIILEMNYIPQRFSQLTNKEDLPSIRETFTNTSKAHIQLIEQLLEYGANVNAKGTKFSRTPLHHIVSKIKYFQNLHEKISKYTPKDDPKVVEFIEKETIKMNQVIIERLIQRGADLNAIDICGLRPIDIAAKNKSREIEDLLRVHSTLSKKD